MKRLLFLVSVLIPAKIFAQPLCPVCTFAIAGGLGIARLLGVRDEVVGVWAGAALFAFAGWTVTWLEKKNIKALWVKILCWLAWYGSLIILYVGKKPYVIFNWHKLFWIDSFLVSVAAGTLAAFLGAKLYQFLKKKNGGKAHFPYERVVIPVVLVALVSAAFHFGYKPRGGHEEEGRCADTCLFSRLGCK